MDAAAHVTGKARAAKAAARALALASTRTKDEALQQMARGLEEKTAAIIEANRGDLERGRAAGLTRAFLDRLTLTEARIAEMATGLRQIAALPDPVGETVDAWRRPNGLEISRVRVPLGVVGFIYESRPNVTADAAGLCLKSGNAVLLRGGSEALDSNTAITQVLARAVEKTGLPAEAVQVLDTADRAAVMSMLTLDRYIDLIIPRGGEEFVRLVAEKATVPVLKHDRGLCHVYVDESADLEMAAAIVVNAKAQRVSVCNSAETLLVHAAVAEGFLPAAAARLQAAGVELRGCERTRALVPAARPAAESDWDSTTSWPCGWWRASRRPSTISGAMARGSRRRSSPRTSAARGASPRRSTRRPWSSMPPRASSTARSSAWGRRWGSRHRGCTRAGRWACGS